MINIVSSNGMSNDNRSVIVANSTDTLPTNGIHHGSLAEIVDTGDIYLFDEAAGNWVKI